MKDSLEAERCAQYLKALADPIRLQIVSILLEGTQSVSDLAERLEADMTTVSHHLKVLFNSGLVESERNGRFIHYSLAAWVLARSDSHVLDFGCCTFELSDRPAKRPER